MPVSSKRIIKKKKKINHISPKQKFQGYRIVTEICSQMDDILVETATAAKTFNLLNGELAVDDKLAAEESLRRLITLLTPVQTQPVVEGEEPAPIRRSPPDQCTFLRAEANKLANSRFTRDEDFMGLTQAAESLLVNGGGAIVDELGILTSIIDRYDTTTDTTPVKDVAHDPA